jgi:hypothetical protein
MKFRSAPQTAAEVEHPAARPDAYLLGHELVLAPLSLLETRGKVAVGLGFAEVHELPQAEPQNPIDHRIAELEILAVSHRNVKITGATRPRADRERRSEDGMPLRNRPSRVAPHRWHLPYR